MNLISPIDPDSELPPLPPECTATQEALVDEELPLSSRLTEHLNACADCRFFQSALPILRHNLAKLPAALPTERAVANILQACVSDRRSRVRRQWAGAGLGAAVAASIVIALFWSREPSRPVDHTVAPPPADMVQIQRPSSDEQVAAPVPPIRETILEARSSVVANLQRSADKTVQSTLSWLPDAMTVPDRDPLQPLEPAVQSLSEVGQGAAMSVQPLADSARRAVGLFWKEIPSVN